MTFSRCFDEIILLVYILIICSGKLMDVKVFKTFLELAQVGHFGKAAENLYITQAAVSARIKQLEVL